MKPNQSRDEDGTDSQDSFAFDRRSALKGGALGLAALTGFASNAAAHHNPGHGGGSGGSGGGGGDSGANQFRFAGEEWHHLYASSEPAENSSEIVTLLRVDGVKQSNSWQDSLTFQPSLESSLVTDIGLSGDEDRSRAAAGVLGWIEIAGDTTGGEWQMVTVDDELVDPPGTDEIDAEGDLVGDTGRKYDLARGIVGFNSRDFRAEWDLTEITEAIDDLQEALEELDEDDETELEETDWDELFLDMYLRTRSTNSFNFTKTNVPGTHDVRLRGALHVFTDDDADDVQAQAIVGNRTMFVEPRKIRSQIDSDDK